MNTKSHEFQRKPNSNKMSKNFFKTTALALAAVAFLSINACKKDPLTKTYTIAALSGQTINAKVTFTEDGDKTKVKVELMGAMASKTYDVHIHEGTLTTYTPAPAYDLGKVSVAAGATTGMVETTIAKKYADMIVYNGIFAGHDAGPVVTAGGIGKNGM